MATGKVSLKLLVDKKRRTVLFAEAGKDFVDFLIHIFVLPVGQAIQLLTKAGPTGIGNLHSSIGKLSEDVFVNSSKKDACLKPKAPAFLSEIPFLLPESTSLDSPPPKTYYRCSLSRNPNCWKYVAEHCSALCPDCKNPMNRTVILVGPAHKNYYACTYLNHSNCFNYMAMDPCTPCPQCKNSMTTKLIPVQSPACKAAATVATAAESDGEGGFVVGGMKYMVMDDLTVKPMTLTGISTITLLKKHKVKDFGHVEEKVVSLGMDEGIKLLRTSFHSSKVLTDVFLGVKRKRS